MRVIQEADGRITLATMEVSLVSVNSVVKAIATSGSISPKNRIFLLTKHRPKT
jgi:hypothetical protein